MPIPGSIYPAYKLEGVEKLFEVFVGDVLLGNDRQ